ncbi:MAG: hypothetical protein JXN60_02850 [Lentisphaerae bacterium]|nr:hypothetical protein [Lentisphaerota bacterium]
MKNFISITGSAYILLVCSVAQTLAMPVGNSMDSINYRYHASDLSQWSAGVYLSPRERNISHDLIQDYTLLSEDTITLYLAYDYKRWVSLYCSVAGGESSTDGWESEGIYDIGAGLRLGLLDHDIMDPWLIEDRIRLTGYLQQTITGTKLAGKDVQWIETYASLVLNIINEVTGNKSYLPHAIGVFIGPVFSDIQSRGLSNMSVNEQRQFGYTAGIEIFYTERVSFELGLENFGPSATKAGIHVRF